MPHKPRYKIHKLDNSPLVYFTMRKGRDRHSTFNPITGESSNSMKFGGEPSKVNFYLKSVWDKATLFWRKK